MKKTKIVCTIGPASWDRKTLKALIQAGMNVARLNMSHGSYEEKAEQIRHVRELSEELNKPTAIAADLQGPKIRLGEIEGERQISKGEKISLALNPVDEELPIQFDLTPFIKKSHRIFLNDGLVQLKVVSITGKTIHTEALNSGWVSSHKGVNIPDTNLQGRSLTEKDMNDAEFALQEDVEYIAVSFIQNPSDLKPIKDLIKKYKSTTKIIAKIEKNEAIINLEEIIKEVDAVMVARGDLAIETSASVVPIMQQKMVRLCRQYQKPVIIATQMLESMTSNPRPTRAEASDVANAVLDQVDAVMLSAESASGKYPVETVETMVEIIESVEQNPEFKNYIKVNWDQIEPLDLELSAITSSAASLSYRLQAKGIVASSATGRTIRALAAFRPDSPILAVTHDEKTARQLNLCWGTVPTVVRAHEDNEKYLDSTVASVKSHLKKGDKLVVVSGRNIGQSGGTDSVKVLTI